MSASGIPTSTRVALLAAAGSPLASEAVLSPARGTAIGQDRKYNHENAQAAWMEE
jgi:hypothetical protein